jgi:hypothetical protein
VLNRLLLMSIGLVFFVPADVKAVSFEDEGTTIVTTPGSIVSLDIVDGLSLSSFDAVVCITDGARIVNAEYEHEGVVLPPFLLLKARAVWSSANFGAAICLMVPLLR